MCDQFHIRVEWVQTASVAALLAIAGFLPCSGFCDPSARPALVQFSNGETVEGSLSLTPGSELKLHTGKELKTLSLDLVQQMVFEPEKEKMEQKWRFVEAGRTQKETWGKPYPVREIRASISLADGSLVRGHLYTAVLYLEGKEQTSKVVLRAKDRGGEGQTFMDLVYPVRIAFTDKAQSVAGALSIKVADSNATELVALTPGALLRLPADRSPGQSLFRITGMTTTNTFLAVRSATGFTVGWQGGSDTALVGRIEQALSLDEDFFDSKTLLGVQRCDDDVYSLLMLARKGHTTLVQEKSQPWRLEIWRWKDSGDRLMVASRGYFYRGLTRTGENPPPVLLMPDIRVVGPGEGAVPP